MTFETIDERLENWAKAQRLGRPGRRAVGSAEGRYIGGAPSVRCNYALLVDEKDADEVENAWRRLLRFDKEVLRLYFIMNMDPRIICRKLHIPHKPANTFYMALAHAKREIAKSLQQGAHPRRDSCKPVAGVVCCSQMTDSA